MWRAAPVSVAQRACMSLMSNTEIWADLLVCVCVCVYSSVSVCPWVGMEDDQCILRGRKGECKLIKSPSHPQAGGCNQSVRAGPELAQPPPPQLTQDVDARATLSPQDVLLAGALHYACFIYHPTNRVSIYISELTLNSQ